MDTNLCIACGSFFRKAFETIRENKKPRPSRHGEVYYQEKHHKDLFSLREAAENDCPLCIVFNAQLQHQIDHDPSPRRLEEFRSISMTIKLIGSAESASKSAWTLLLDIWATGRSIHDGRKLYLRIELYPSTISVSSGMNYFPKLAYSSSATDFDTHMVLVKEIPIESSTISNSALQLIKSWLGQCENKHLGCRTDQVQFPTRLIYLEPQKSRIVDTLSIPKLPRYLTLSHCWGTIKLMRLTKANSQDMHAGIQEDDLCQTFKDALYITRALGFNYIWIDSLCIIQDDPDDWRKEASRMCDVYSGSTLTLAASSAPDGSHGCLYNRSPETLRRIRRYSIPIPVNGTSRMYDFLDLKLYEENVQKSALSTRGWVLQERVLSPRTLHFTEMQLYWECNEKIACETFQDKLHYSETDNLRERTNHREMWASIIHHYTRRNLTYGSDKLIAMSGMAQWIHHQTGDQYLAGLWKKSLELQLLWEFEDSPGQYHEGRAPSWSWAAYDGGIDIWARMPTASRLLISLAAAEIDPVGDDLYGAVASGKLRLEVPLLLGVTLWPDHTRSQIKDAGYLSNGKSNPIYMWEDKPGYNESPLEWYCLPILEIDDGEDKLYSGLMVEPTKDGVRGQFRRVGNFKVGLGKYGDPKFSNRYAKFVQALRDPKCWAKRSIFEPIERKALFNSGKDKLYITLV